MQNGDSWHVLGFQCLAKSLIWFGNHFIDIKAEVRMQKNHVVEEFQTNSFQCCFLSPPQNIVSFLIFLERGDQKKKLGRNELR